MTSSSGVGGAPVTGQEAATGDAVRSQLEAENQRLRATIQRVRNANLNVLEIDPPTLCFSSSAMHDCWACGVGFVFREISGALGTSEDTADA